jgi:hypothetical protein
MLEENTINMESHAPMVRVKAMLPEKLQFKKTAESPETTVSPALEEDRPSYEFELRM